MTTHQVYTDILSGKHDSDDGLDRIMHAIVQRKKMLVSNLRPGQTVWFTSKVKPRYLCGVKCTVKHVNRETITVNIPQDTYTGRFGHEIRVPMTLLTPTQP